MLYANNFVFLVDFEASSNGSFIVNTENENNGLVDLAKFIKERKKENRHYFKVYQFDRSKRKFMTIPMQKFITVTEFCTELNVVLREIFIR